mmetsp:Transcript_18012/g.22086  ORF Transcript_18012/g.22086 Transcript_18012/m.22086 type:complete len:394 (-) Transcript_18012:698-1879(-)
MTALFYEEEEEEEEKEEEGAAANSKYAELFGEEKALELTKAIESARALERENIKTVDQREWELRGEVQATDRPENSLLGVDATWDGSKKTSRRQNLAGTELTEAIEQIIRQRIAENKFDDLVPAELQAVAASTTMSKQSAESVGDQVKALGEKSSLGLAEEYEQDYLKNLENSTAADRSAVKIHRDSELDALWSKLALKLDALSHFAEGTRAAPRPVLDLEAAAKAANAAAVSLEDTTPAAVSVQDTSAPEKIYAKTRGKAGLLQSTQEASREQRKAKRAAKKRARAAARKKVRVDAEQLAAISPNFTNPFQGASSKKEKRKRDGTTKSKDIDSSPQLKVSSSGGSTALFEQLTKEVRTAIHGSSSGGDDSQSEQQRKKPRLNKNGAAAVLKL